MVLPRWRRPGTSPVPMGLVGNPVFYGATRAETLATLQESKKPLLIAGVTIDPATSKTTIVISIIQITKQHGTVAVVNTTQLISGSTGTTEAKSDGDGNEILPLLTLMSQEVHANVMEEVRESSISPSRQKANSIINWAMLQLQSRLIQH